MTQNQPTYPSKLSKLDFFTRWEVAELPKLLMPDEHVLGVLSGFYSAGTAILCVTSKRLLVVDKKLMRLSIEDIRFDSIAEVNYSHQMFMASARFYIAGKELQFRSWYRRELRTMVQFVQNKMFEAKGEPQNTPSTILQKEIAPASPTYAANAEKPKPKIQTHLYSNLKHWRRSARSIGALPLSSSSNFTKR